jgi:hypothetical protein
MVPMVGWPANGSSTLGVKISMVRLVVVSESPGGRCRNTVSERLNSAAMDCFWL